MIKVEYILDGQAGELELSGLTGFDSLADALSVHGSETVSDALAKYLLEDQHLSHETLVPLIMILNNRSVINFERFY
ncbi:hypothetical protein VCSRO94_3454 [Vibrio cholerae]|nr:hypothetical protein VCSRO94_3454 [Vibrio cholerae]